MKHFPPRAPFFTLVTRFVALLLLFMITRFIFYWSNLEEFDGINSAIFWSGLRFDTAAICILNSIYFVFLMLPFHFVEKRISRIIGDVYFVTINAIALLTNLIDCCYYPFAMRRLTGDIFAFIGETNNFGQLIPTFLKEYWYFGLIWLIFIALLILTARMTESEGNRYPKIPRLFKSGISVWISHIILRLFILFLILTGARGGWQKRPMNISMASSVSGVENAALVLNTPYSLITTLGAQGLERMHYFSDDECKSVFDIHRHFDGSAELNNAQKSPLNGIPRQYSKPINVVLIILEGISSEYSAYLADEPKNIAGFTPFLDSLAKKSIVFKGYANGQQSIEALTSILGGIPSLMSSPFSQSQYTACNIQYAVPALKKAGMQTLFFHGGDNGTMGFDRFCYMNRFDHYFGRNEYDAENKAQDYDGSWGIADLPYLQYVAKILSQYEDPFFATVFTLSSHHPFIVPEEYDNKLPFGEFPMQHCVAYTDEALRQFFAYASHTDWYDNTLFVITADHTNFNDADHIDYYAHRYSVPMIFYYPKADTCYRSKQIVQQLDIMPSIIDFCGITASFTSFGHSAFDNKAPRFAINYLSGVYELYYLDFLIEFDGKEITHIYDLSDGDRELDSKDVNDIQYIERFLKAVIQRFNNGLLDNNL